MSSMTGEQAFTAGDVPCNINFDAWVGERLQLRDFIRRTVRLCRPRSVHVCNGSDTEYRQMCDRLVEQGVFKKIPQRPDSYWSRTVPNDVARLEARTFICSETQEKAGPTNNWMEPEKMKAILNEKFTGCMEGRTMYVLPFCMGPLGSKHSRIGVQLTDSPYVVVNMQIMTRMGDPVMRQLKAHDFFVPCVHSVGYPLRDGMKDHPFWPCNDDKYIVQFPEERAIWSFGSGYGGNALLNKKCFALRIASVMARDEGWLAEHMLVLGITNPEGKKKYIAAAFPSACGKTNLALMQPSLPGWKVQVIGDDIAWMRFGPDGRLYACNAENGFFGVAPGTSHKTCPYGMQSLEKHCIFTNTGLTADGDVIWEGMDRETQGPITTWLGETYTPGQGPMAHPNARYTAPMTNCPIVDPDFNNPQGVPISAILFGGRRRSLVPLVYQAFDWTHGTLVGSMVSSEVTAAAEGTQGVLRHDPFAMLPFCGYNMGDYFRHWISMGQRATDPRKLPMIFNVNWFRRDADGKFLWPGYGENARVLKWVFERTDGEGKALETPIGYIPETEAGAIDMSGLEKVSPAALKQLFEIDVEGWKEEMTGMVKYLSQFGEHLPEEMSAKIQEIRGRLESWEKLHAA